MAVWARVCSFHWLIQAPGETFSIVLSDRLSG
jgi:hypothetical protein